MEAVHFKNIKEIEKIRTLLENDQPVLVEFCAQATRHPILLVPDSAIIHIGFRGKTYNDTKPGSYVYVGLMEFGRLYPLSLGYLHRGYTGEKLGIRNEADAENVTEFLNALGHPDGVTDYLSKVPMQNDHVDHSSWAR